MTAKVLKVLGLGFLGTLIISCIGLTMIIHKDTLTPLWQPLTLSLILAFGSGWFLWSKWCKLTNNDSIWINYGLHIVTVATFLLCFFYMGNYFLGDRENITYEDSRIARLYREQHYRTRRISRKVYGRGAPYWVYKADLELPDGSSKDIRLTKKHYDDLFRGDTLGLAVRTGFFGVKVFDTSKIKYPPQKVRKTHKRRHFGPRYRKTTQEN